MNYTDLAHARAFTGAVHLVFGDGVTSVQTQFTDALLHGYFGVDLRLRDAKPWSVEQLRTVYRDGRDRHLLIEALVMLEMAAEGGGESQARGVEQLAEDLGVQEPQLIIGRDAALGALGLLRDDWNRFREDPVASEAVLEEEPAAVRRLGAIAQCAPGTVGRALHSFYACQQYPDPGQPGFGALSLVAHDTHHVIAGYGTAPQEEIALQAMLVTTTLGDRHFSGFTASLALFELGAMKGFFGDVAPRVHILRDPSVRELIVEGLVRGHQTGSDWTELDAMEILDESLEELRLRCRIPPRQGEPAYASKLLSVAED